LNVIVYEPEADGIPETIPVAESNKRPKGGRGEATHVKGATPPVTVNVAKYDKPIAPLGNEEVVILRGGTTNKIGDFRAVCASIS
jgi:hypothetical protein